MAAASATKTTTKAAPKEVEKNIFQRMSAITDELQTVAKNLTVSTGKNNSYKAVSERDILDAVKPLEAKHGVYSYPVKREILESHMLESSYNGIATKKTTFMTRIETTYRFVNVDKPEEYIETTTFAEGIDTQDKGSGKAMTYGDKYALMKAYKISTGDDPDQKASEDTHYTQQQENPLVDATKIKVLKERMKKKGVKDSQILERYKVNSFEELTVLDFMKACNGLEKMPDIENKQVDLGL